MTKTIESTTIMIYLDTKAKLDSRKIHPNQSYDEVIKKLLKQTEEEANST